MLDHAEFWRFWATARQQVRKTLAGQVCLSSRKVSTDRTLFLQKSRNKNKRTRHLSLQLELVHWQSTVIAALKVFGASSEERKKRRTLTLTKNLMRFYAIASGLMSTLSCTLKSSLSAELSRDMECVGLETDVSEDFWSLKWPRAMLQDGGTEKNYEVLTKELVEV